MANHCWHQAKKHPEHGVPSQSEESSRGHRVHISDSNEFSRACPEMAFSSDCCIVPKIPYSEMVRILNVYFSVLFELGRKFSSLDRHYLISLSQKQYTVFYGIAE